VSHADPHAASPVLVAGAPLDRSERAARVAVVLVHGRGGSADDILGVASPLAARVGAEGVAYLAPQAADHTWYPERAFRPIAENQPYLDSALARLARLRDEITAAGVPDERIVWFGFSQGACLASDFVARNPCRWGGLVVATGGRIGPLGVDIALPGDLQTTPVYVGCGDPDPHIPWSRVEETARAFAAQGAEVTLRRYPGFPHSIHPEAISFAARAIAAALG
jgi:phospholipase/carboxylesterase